MSRPSRAESTSYLCPYQKLRRRVMSRVIVVFSLRNGRPTRTTALAPPRSVEPPASTLPGDHGFGADDPQGVFPVGRDARQPDSDDSVGQLQLASGSSRPQDDIELVAERDVLGGKLSRRRERAPDRTKGIADEAEHRATLPAFGGKHHDVGVDGFAASGDDGEPSTWSMTRRWDTQRGLGSAGPRGQSRGQSS